MATKKEKELPQEKNKKSKNKYLAKNKDLVYKMKSNYN